MLLNLKPLIVNLAVFNFVLTKQSQSNLVCLTTTEHRNILIGARQKLARKSHTRTLVIFKLARNL